MERRASDEMPYYRKEEAWLRSESRKHKSEPSETSRQSSIQATTKTRIPPDALLQHHDDSQPPAATNVTTSASNPP